MKKLIKANSLYLGISLLSSSSAILLIPLYISNFSVEAYGELALMNTTFSLLAIVLTLSIESAFQTFYFDHEGKALTSYFRNIYSFAVLMVLVISSLMAIAGPGLFNLIFSSEKLGFYPNGFLITLSVAFTLLNQIYYVKLRNEEKIKRFGRFVIINTISSICLQVFLIIYLQMGVSGAILGALVANILAFICTLPELGIKRLQINFQVIQKSLKYCLWLIPFFLANWFVAKGDRVIVENYIGLEAVGTYALLMNIAMIISLLTTSVLNSLRPTLFGEFKRVKSSLSVKIIHMGLYFTGIIAVASIVLYIFVQHLDRFNLFADYIKVQEYIFPALVLFFVRGLIRLVCEYLSFRKMSKDMFFTSVANLAIYAPLLTYFSHQLDLRLLLIILIVSNLFALISVTGRCYYLFRFRADA